MPVLGQDDTRLAAEEAAKALLEEKEPDKSAKPDRFKNWTSSAKTDVNFVQSQLTNWAAGGDNTFTLSGYVDANANYKKDSKFWNNRLQLYYGFIYSSSKPILQKNSDRIYLESKYGYQVKKSLYLSADYSFETQFSKGYTYGTPGAAQIGDAKLEDLSLKDQIKAWKAARVPKSGFLSPANTRLALGIDWKPASWISVNVAPATGALVIVTDPEFRRAYSMPVRPEYEALDPASEEYLNLQASGNLYSSARFELGAQIKTDVNVIVNNNFNYNSQLVLFSNYLKNPENVRVSWDNRFSWTMNKFFKVSLYMQTIYDDTILIKNEKDIDKYPDGTQRLQFKETLTLGFTYTLAKTK